MAEIDNYEDSSAQTTDDVESSEEKTDSGDEESSRDSRDTGDEDDDPSPCQFVQEKSLVWIYEVFPHLGKYAKKSLDFPLPIPRLLRWHTTKNDNIVEGDPFKYNGRSTKIVHPYLIPIVRETKQNYMETLKLYTDEVKDTIIDALKANLKGVTVLTSAVENEKDEILCENNSNQPLVNEDYTTPTVDKDGATIDVDEILPLAIVDEDLVAVDGYFTEEVNEAIEEMKEGEKEQEDEKLEEKEEEKMEEKKQGEEKMEEKEEEENKEEDIEEKKEEDKEEEKQEEYQEKEEEKQEEDQEKEEEKKVEEQISVDVMDIVMDLNGDV
ncbi:hypothetical protein KY285_031035 [Solanum tuberosum]|nr:hypothetical protein KY285_031035 [Solanum tuberosum]